MKIVEQRIEDIAEHHDIIEPDRIYNSIEVIDYYHLIVNVIPELKKLSAKETSPFNSIPYDEQEERITLSFCSQDSNFAFYQLNAAFAIYKDFTLIHLSYLNNDSASGSAAKYLIDNEGVWVKEINEGSDIVTACLQLESILFVVEAALCNIENYIHYHDLLKKYYDYHNHKDD